MDTRRTFIQKSAFTVLGAGLLPKELISKPAAFEPQDSSWAEVRKQFSLTNNRVYLNNGTSGPSPRPVVEALTNKLTELATSGEYKGQEDSRAPIANLVGASPEEISLTRNTTEGINIIAGGLPLNKGDEVIMTSHEHAGNALPWLNVAKHKQVVIKVIEPGNSQAENLQRINDQITSRTRVIAVPHITCTTGLVYPIKSIAKLARDKGIWSFFDGAHGPGSMPIDLTSIDCDFYASCGHKWLLGPAGTGFLYVNKRSLDVLIPQAIGAYSNTGWVLDAQKQKLDGYVPTAHRFDYGTQSAPIANGLKAAVDFMDAIGMDKVGEYNRALAENLFEGLSANPQVELLSPQEKESRSTMITFRVKGMDYREVGKKLSTDFRVRLVPESGLDAIRISTHIYNNQLEISRFLKKLNEITG